ncbi:M23 family metallopeptidase [Alteromonas sp. ASW11-36]|uniref:M23 family metallopeptidase n=1 Tax=Alteromonas arenosi TaxID=3055817 RepID=A0ABT7SXW1_9ALTE|nr:M23 family metallopeptidase [Alteromonas sp. ASW11-36]MDM7861018.1 M23 family metallopeptidase [Alteromonas sp. ASW11-36]
MVKRSIRTIIFLSIAAIWVSFSARAAFTLLDEPQPGALVRGVVETPETRILFNGEALKVSPNGDFVFGLSRDATGSIEIEWQSASESGSKRYALPSREYDIQRIDGLPQNMVTPDESVLARIRQDNQQVAQARAGDTDFNYFMQSFIWPAEGRLSGVYGSQRMLNGEPRRPHYGLDIAAPTGTPVLAPADGVVTLFVPDMYFSGGTLIIDHGHKVSSTFIHLHKAHVEVGDYVKQGQLIAEIGATGRVTGAHLDWRINWGKVRVDPQLLVPERE